MTRDELKDVIKECVSEITEDIYINENYDSEYITEEAFDKLGLSKDDLQDKQKVKKKVDKKKSGWDKVKTILLIIGAAIAAIPIAIFAPIIMNLYDMISKIKSSLSSNSLDKTIRELEKTLEKLKKQLEKETDPEKKKELEKLIKETEKKIAELKEEKRKADVEKRLWYELEVADNVKDMINSNDWYKDDYDENCFALAISIGKVPANKIYSKLGNGKYDVCSWYFSLEEEDNPELYAQFKKHFKMTDAKEKCFVDMYAIDDTLYVYGIKTNSFYFGDWYPDEKYFYTYNQLKALGEKLQKDPKYIEAFAEIGIEL